MNDKRRREIKKLMKKWEQVNSIAEEIRLDIETIRDEEQEAFDALPEGLQNAERAEHMIACVDAMDEVMSYMDDVVGKDWEEDLFQIINDKG